MIFLQVFFYSWLITHFQPLKELINWIKPNRFNYIIKSLFKVPTCMFCCGFWLMLILTGNIFYAAIIAFINFWYGKIFLYCEEYEKIDMSK